MQDLFTHPFLSIPYLWCRYQIREIEKRDHRLKSFANDLSFIGFYQDLLQKHLASYSPPLQSYEWEIKEGWLDLPLPFPKEPDTSPETEEEILAWLKEKEKALLEEDQALRKPKPISREEYNRLMEEIRLKWQAERLAKEEYERTGDPRKARIAAGKLFFPRINKALDGPQLQTLKGLYRDTLKVFQLPWQFRNNPSLQKEVKPYLAFLQSKVDAFLEDFDAFNKATDPRLGVYEPHELATQFLLARIQDITEQAIREARRP